MASTSAAGFRYGFVIIAAGFLCLGFSSSGQAPSSTFAVASVKPSGETLGRDRAPSRLSFQSETVRGRNVTLKTLIREAYGLGPYQVAGPDWLDEYEFDIEARSDRPATREDLRRMFQTLITERFSLSFHREPRQMNVYALILDKGGPKIHPLPGASEQRSLGFPEFRGDLQDLADLIGVQLSIPTVAPNRDPAQPYIAVGPPIPVIDSTGLPGIYELTVDVKPEIALDMFTSWQRFLEEHCGLKLESQKSQVPVLVVERAERMPRPN